MSEQPVVYIPDISYDSCEYYSNLDEIESFKKLLLGISKKLQLPAKETNIGIGADCPAIALEVMQYIRDKEALLIGIALFFSGKKIKENLEAWQALGNKMVNVLLNYRTVFNRSAAILIGLQKYKEEHNIAFKNIQLLQYEALDSRLVDSINATIVPKKGLIVEESSEEFIGHIIHYFRLNINEEEVEIFVRNELILIRKKAA